MKLILLSTEQKDIETFEAASDMIQHPFVAVGSPESLCAELDDNPSSIVVVDASTDKKYFHFEKILSEKIGLLNNTVSSNNVIFLSDNELYHSPYIASSELLGTFMPKKFTSSDLPHIVRALRAIEKTRQPSQDFKIERFFNSGTKIQNLKLTKSSQKTAVIESLKVNLYEAGFKMRVASVIASAFDELVINAFFDAPVDELGRYIYLKTPRNTLIEMDEQHPVDIEIAFDGDTIGISVLDHFGSLNKRKMHGDISKSYTEEEYKMKTHVAGAGLGLAQVYRNGGGLIFECEQGAATCVTLFYKKTDSFKQFKDQFHFMSSLLYFES